MVVLGKGITRFDIYYCSIRGVLTSENTVFTIMNSFTKFNVAYSITSNSNTNRMYKQRLGLINLSLCSA